MEERRNIIGGKFSPFVVSLRGLGLVQDTNSNYGLSFVLTDESTIIEAPQLLGSSSRKLFNYQDERGLPILEDSGKRMLYVGYSGLSRLMCSGRSISSTFTDLAFSNDSGRIALTN